MASPPPPTPSAPSEMVPTRPKRYVSSPETEREAEPWLYYGLFDTHSEERMKFDKPNIRCGNNCETRNSSENIQDRGKGKTGETGNNRKCWEEFQINRNSCLSRKSCIPEYQYLYISSIIYISLV